jgi:2-keto-4-pentenoate hydratase/2-oxohepta-3-ene-1,7-dioic acid hydratase in catechol pathway
MRVTNIQTEDGQKLAIRNDGKWVKIEGTNAPTSVDDLIRGGEQSRRDAEELARSGDAVADSQLSLCVPWPGKIICIGLNYRRHAIEAKLTLTETPLIFAKFGNSLATSGQSIPLPSTAKQYDYEAELGVVIGRRAVNVAEGEALEYVWGYCNCNDLTARELQARTSQFVLGKTLDGFLPVGPELVSADEVGDPQNLAIRTWVNGEVRQDSNTSDMVFSVANIVSYISRYIPLEVGDFIATGTPGGVILGMDPQVWMVPGDIVDVEIEGLGRLTSPLVAASW